MKNWAVFLALFQITLALCTLLRRLLKNIISALIPLLLQGGAAWRTAAAAAWVCTLAYSTSGSHCFHIFPFSARHTLAHIMNQREIIYHFTTMQIYRIIVIRLVCDECCCVNAMWEMFKHQHRCRPFDLQMTSHISHKFQFLLVREEGKKCWGKICCQYRLSNEIDF